MLSKFSMYFIAIMRLLVFICVILFLIGVSRSPFIPKPAEESEVVSSSKEFLYLGGITDYVVCNDRLFVLYGNKRGMQCYDLNGTFLYNYTFSYPLRGRPKLYTDGATVWVKSGIKHYYGFSSDGFSVFYHRAYNAQTIERIEARVLPQEDTKTTADGDRIMMRGASIWKVSADGSEEKIVSRPFWLIIYQENRICIAAWLLFLFMCLYIAITSRFD